MENNKLNEIVSKESKHTKTVQIMTVEDKMMKISSESKNESPQDDSQKGRVKDLSDSEIVPHLEENTTKNKDIETPSDVTSGLEGGMQSIENDLVETIDQNKAWVEEKNKDNDNISSEQSKESEIINVHPNTSIEEGKLEKIEAPGNKVTKKEHSQEFSPIVFWRDPFPDIAGLEMENIRKQEMKYFQNDAPEIIKTEAKQKNKTCEHVSLDKGKESKKKEEKSKIKNTDHFISLGRDSHIMKSLWLDKSTYENAEVKYYENLARISKEGKNVEGFSNLSDDAKTMKVTKAAKKTEVKHKSVK